MTFSLALTEEQAAVRAWAHGFAEREIRPVAPAYDESEDFPWPVVAKARDTGLYGLDYYEMAAADETGLLPALVPEELTWGCAGITLAILGTGLALSGLKATGTPEQVARWAPRLFAREDGELAVGAFCVTEPGAGSDVSSLRTRAEKVAGGWRLDGQKRFITNGGIADVHLVVATVDPALGHKGQAVFVVPPDTPGLSGGRKERKLGIRASHTADVLLADCVVPDDCLLGGEDALQARLASARSGSATRSGALSTFEATRPLVGAQALGIARAAFELARDYAKERVAFGRPIVANQGVAFKLADMATEIDAARLLVWRAAWMARVGEPFRQAEGSMSKLKAGEVAVRVTDEAIQVLGGYGYIRDYPAEKWHRDAKIYCIFEGTSEIQRLVVSRAVAAAP